MRMELRQVRMLAILLLPQRIFVRGPGKEVVESEEASVLYELAEFLEYTKRGQRWLVCEHGERFRKNCGKERKPRAKKAAKKATSAD